MEKEKNLSNEERVDQVVQRYEDLLRVARVRKDLAELDFEITKFEFQKLQLLQAMQPEVKNTQPNEEETTEQEGLTFERGGQGV
jgi:hypothetical protein